MLTQLTQFTTGRALLLVIGFMPLVLNGCSAPNPSTQTSKSGTSVLVLQNSASNPRLTFGDMTLLTTVSDLENTVKQAGWMASSKLVTDGSVTLTPPAGHEVKRAQVRLEEGRIVQIAVTFRQPLRSRVAMRHDYACSKIQSDGSWAMTDNQRATLVLLGGGGDSLVATHLQATRDRMGARAMLERYLGQ